MNLSLDFPVWKSDGGWQPAANRARWGRAAVETMTKSARLVPETAGWAARSRGFGELAEGHVDTAYRLAGYLLSDSSEAEDAIQEALVRAWRGWPSLREQSSFNAWLDRIVVNVCRDRLAARRGVRVLSYQDEDEIEGPDPFRSALAHDAVGRGLEHLPAEQRAVVVLRFWRDLPLAEIAALLEIPLGTVKSRLHNALRTLAQEIDR
jgi:RNA polymerase sigma-70 factor, ECF subfamily